MRPSTFWQRPCGWALFTLGCAAGWCEARERLELDGAWQYQKVSQVTYPPPASGWNPTTVPGYLSGDPYEQAWFRRSFTAPATWTGGRVKLRFGGVKYRAAVWLNGQSVGGCTNGYDPFELDVTPAILPGQVNTVVVGVTDWTGLFSSAVDFSNLAPGEGLRDRARDVVRAPIGGHFELYGIWESVTLDWVPAVSIADIFVLPSLNPATVRARVRVRNESGVEVAVVVRADVADTGAGGLALGSSGVTVGAGAVQEVELSAVWPGARLWSPEDPFLQVLETRLEVAGAPVDQVDTRFGIREFRAAGDRFQLNGTNLHLRATSSWPPVQPMTREAVRQVLVDVKAGHNNAYRLHTQPWPEVWYDVADEVGLLIVEEAAVWCDPRAYRLSDPVFWGHYAEHLRALVARDRNHPSIILWSLENEILHCGGDTLSASAITELAALGTLVKALDPTRPITYEADLDPGGVADVLGLHYPHEFPDYVLWPDTGYWLDQPLAKSYAPGGTWTWDRAKPLYIGEFLWVPDTAAQGFTVLFGDPAYADPRALRNQAKAFTWRMQIEAYRDQGVSAFCPWTMFEDPAAPSGVIGLNTNANALYQAQAAAYHPNAVFAREYDTRFYAGSPVERTLVVCNDTSVGGDFSLRWGVGGAAATRALTLEPSQKTVEGVTFTVPSEPGPFVWVTELWRGSTLVFRSEQPMMAHARAPLTVPAGIRLGLHDPKATTAAVFGGEGLTWVPVSNLATADYGGFDLLVVGKDAFDADPVPTVGMDPVAARWKEFTARGGWIVVLEQTVYPSWMPLGLTLVEEPTHFAFPVRQHPVLAGLSEADLRWWRGGHRVAHRTIRAPSRGNARVLAHVGSAQGLEQAVLVEAQSGAGGLRWAQARLVEALDTVPIARVLLQRLLENRPGTAAGFQPAGLVTETNSAVAGALQRSGVLGELIEGALDAAALHQHAVVLVAGGDATWTRAQVGLNALSAYVAQGGTVWLHRPSEAFLRAAQSGLLGGVGWETNLALPILRRDATEPPEGLTTHDLYWVEDPGSWNRPAVLATNVAARAYRLPFTLTNYTVIQAETMPVKTTGAAVTQGWLLYANGYLAQTVTFPTDGVYQVGVRARGDPAFGVAPQLTLRIDGTFQDALSVTNTAGWQLYALAADLTAGPHELALAFENDVYNPPNEDRNLYLDQAWYGPAPADVGVSPLTRPAVLAEIRQGAGRVLLDEVQWDSPGRHLTKAERVLSALSTRLGVAVAPPEGLRLEAEAMRPSGFPGPGLVVTNQGVVWYYANGQLSASVRFNATGSYGFELAGLGTPAAGEFPRADLRIDGSLRGYAVVNTAALSTFRIATTVTAGVHTVAVTYGNDLYQGGEDRNLGLDYLRIRPEPVPDILGAAYTTSPAAFELTWTSEPDRRYAVEFRADWAGAPWSALVTNAAVGSVSRWVDDGSIVGDPPSGSARPRGYYRIRLLP